MALVVTMPPELYAFARGTFGIAVILDLIFTMIELGVPHGSAVTAAALHAIRQGRYARMFWGGAIVAGHLVPLGLLALGNPAAAGLAAVCAAVGLYLFEYAFVMAPQEVPNS